MLMFLGKVGHYMYIDASGHEVGRTAALVTGTLQSADVPVCLQFWYNMYGEHVDQLRLTMVTAFDDMDLWVRQGKLDNRWFLGEKFINVSQPYSVSQLPSPHSSANLNSLKSLFKISFVFFRL